MKVRTEKTEDFYKTVIDWWNGHSILHNGKKVSYPLIPIAILPQKVFVLNEKGNDTYCVFFYETDSSLCYLAYPTRNPKYKKNKK